MREQLRITCLILLCLYSLFFIIGSTLAPVMAHFQHFEISAQLTATYMYSCHQQPDRSFWLLGYPIALCCRCYGVYLSTAVSCILSLYNRLNISYKTVVLLLILSAIDIYINYGMGKLNNTGNITRFIAGILLGIVIVKGLDTLLRTKGKRKNEDEKGNC